MLQAVFEVVVDSSKILFPRLTEEEFVFRKYIGWGERSFDEESLEVKVYL